MNSKSIIGAILCLAGVFLSYTGYISASGGGTYKVWWGAIAVGMYLFIKGFTEEQESKASEEAMKVTSQVNASVNQGIALSNQGKYDEAIKHYNNAININPYDASIWSYKGNSLYNKSNYDEAIKCYDEAIRLGKIKAECCGEPNLELLMQDPINAVSWKNKGLALINQKNYDDALKCFDEAVKLSPQDSKAWHLKGAVSEILERNREADAAFAKAKELGYSG